MALLCFFPSLIIILCSASFLKILKSQFLASCSVRVDVYVPSSHKRHSVIQFYLNKEKVFVSCDCGGKFHLTGGVNRERSDRGEQEMSQRERLCRIGQYYRETDPLSVESQL